MNVRSNQRSTKRDLLPLLVVGALSLIALAFWLFRAKPLPLPPPAIVHAPGPVAPPPPPQPVVFVAPNLTPADLARAVPGADGRLQLPHGNGTLQLTLDAKMQASLTAMLDKLAVPYAAIVLIDPKTGALIAAVEHREPGDPTGAIGSLTEPATPAASVFKVITAAALLDAGLTPESKECFRGGLHGIDASHLRDIPGESHCETMTEALAHSSNAAFGKFALHSLPLGNLTKMAEQFGFNHQIASDFKIAASPMRDGVTNLERGRTAPGFIGSSLSPLHAAWIAAALANGGQAMRPFAVASDSTQAGLSAQPSAQAQILPKEQALALGKMMEQTVLIGTGRHAFGARPAALRDLAIAGKTGSLSGADPTVFRHFSWFVGFVPGEQRQVAVAVLAINGLKWRAKAATIARDALAQYYAVGAQTVAAHR